jgi:YD repeat-containing protein
MQCGRVDRRAEEARKVRGTAKRRSGRLLVWMGLIGALALASGPADYLAAQSVHVVRVNPYFAVGFTAVGGEDVVKVIISGPPDPPPGFPRTAATVPQPHPEAGINVLPNVPAFTWCFGCSATSGAMIAGYYDRVGYPLMYTGPMNGGVIPMNNSSWGLWQDGCSAWRAQCPLSATRSGLDGRIALGHVDDYWVCYLDPGPDPFADDPDDPLDPSWSEHAYGDCTADYMKTNQAAYGNDDGSTTFWYNPSGTKWSGTFSDDGGYGLQLFYESRGYTVIDRYNRVLLGYDWDGPGTEYGPATQGATFADYKAEIDAGRPVMIHLEGHTMVGVGYDDSSNLMYIHDTWDHSTHTMTWGGSYGGGLHMGITIVTLAESEIDVRGLGHSIPDGDTSPSAPDSTDFGSVDLGSSDFHTFTVHNTGAYPLSLTGSPRVQISGVHAADFAVTAQPGSVLGIGASTSFTVQFSPSAAGVRTATVTISNTDLNENPYDFSIQGTGNDPSDTTPPTPDPMTWDVAPSVTAPATISMTAAIATDPSGVEYSFEETSGNPGGTSSGWQDSATYSDDGLSTDTQYCYRVKARDKSGNQNETGWSSTTCATTGPPATAAVFRVASDGTVLADSTVYATSFQTGAADVAEWVSVSESVTPGSVVELDPDNAGSYRLSSVVCSQSVAGVISTSPGVVLGHSEAFEQRALLALVGIIPTYATDEGGPILPGDLLVASSRPGYAMRWSGSGPCPCALVGKALEPMTEDNGIILVLLTAH